MYIYIIHTYLYIRTYIYTACMYKIFIRVFVVYTTPSHNTYIYIGLYYIRDDVRFVLRTEIFSLREEFFSPFFHQLGHLFLRYSQNTPCNTKISGLIFTSGYFFFPRWYRGPEKDPWCQYLLLLIYLIFINNEGCCGWPVLIHIYYIILVVLKIIF